MNYTTYQHFVQLWNRVQHAVKDMTPPERDDTEKEFLAWWNQSGWVQLGRHKNDKDVVAGEPIPVHVPGQNYQIERKVT